MTSAENKGPACVYTQAGVSVSKKSFLPAWSKNTPSAQPVSVCFAPENRGPSSKQARFIRPRRRFACFPFLGYLRAKSRLTAVALRNAPAGAVPHTPFLTVTETLSLYRQTVAPFGASFFYFATLPHELGHAAPKKAHDTAGAPPPSARAPLRSESLIY